MSTAYWFGFGRADITVFEPGLSMWGWGSGQNVPTRAATPLFARACVISGAEHDKPHVFLSLDLGMVSESLRRHVLARLPEVDEHRLTLTATHTHSGPSGFSTYLFYALSGPGFSPLVHDTIVDGCVRAVREALSKREAGFVRSIGDEIPVSEPVAFQRSLAAYNRNPDVTPLRADRADEALHRRMTVLRFEDLNGEPKGLINFFAVHATSVHSDFTALHGDNKGLAAAMCEREKPTGFVALFVQESAGDVSPNYRPSKARGFCIGRYDDDERSAEHNAGIQARHAMRLFHAAKERGHQLDGSVTSRLRYSMFHDLRVDAEFAEGREGVRTGDPVLGLGFTFGTPEGPGPLGPVSSAATQFTRLMALVNARRDDAYVRAHGRKLAFWNLGAGAHQTASASLLKLLPERRVRYYLEAQRLRGTQLLSWVPQHLPVQLVKLGDFAMSFVPFEPTTVAGRRLRAHMKTEVGAREVVMCGYSNAYAGYLTTPEEYDEQAYEGSMTLFGRWSFGALATELRRVARQLREVEQHHEVGELPARLPLAQWVVAAKRNEVRS
ncbi:MAG: neutral/alkaline non-lysosomal ceramidase N-terminal domain-containing protein [Archangium sp.]